MDPITVCLCFDLGYAALGFVCISSVLKHNPTAKIIVITLPEQKHSIEMIVDSLQMTVDIISPDNQFISNALAINNAKGITGYLRLSIPTLLWKKYEKILYLDADVLVRTSLKELWNEDISRNAFAAVMDSSYQKYPIDGEPYFNSGVMLLNLPHLVEDNFQEKVLTLLKEQRCNFRWHFGDQEAMHILYKQAWKKMDGKWNVLYKDAAEASHFPECSVIHFAGLSRFLLLGELSHEWAAEWYTVLNILIQRSPEFLTCCINHLCELLSSTNSAIIPLIIKAATQLEQKKQFCSEL